MWEVAERLALTDDERDVDGAMVYDEPEARANFARGWDGVAQNPHGARAHEAPEVEVSPSPLAGEIPEAVASRTRLAGEA